MKPLPSVERLSEVFRLDHETGRLYRRIQTCHRKLDLSVEAGTPGRDGYRRVCIDGRGYLSHRVVWAIATGAWPAVEVDHINLVRTDNRPANLREANLCQNMWNRKKHSHNTSGYRGVTWHSQQKQWRARMQINHKFIELGLYDDAETAGYAYLSASLKLHGEFART